MDVYDMRDWLLSRQVAMMTGDTPYDPRFMSLMEFENWCSNGGLVGFAQVAAQHDLDAIRTFSQARGFHVVVDMIDALRRHDALDTLSAAEVQQLMDYDVPFYDMLDDYTAAVYAEQTSPPLPRQRF